jgi:putative membrane protein
MTSVVLRSVPIALALTMLSAASWAQTTTPPGSGTSMTGNQAAPAAQPGTGTRNAETRKDDQLARADRKFIQQAAEGGMYEVQIAELAASKATDANVKSFADTLVKDHQAANNELVQMANAKKVELPAAPPRAMRRDIERLAQRKGKDFDEHFVREVGIKDHEKDIKMFEKGSGSVKDAQLKAWIDKTLPHLREHLAIAQKLPQAGRGAVDASSMGNRAAPKSGG